MGHDLPSLVMLVRQRQTHLKCGKVEVVWLWLGRSHLPISRAGPGGIPQMIKRLKSLGRTMRRNRLKLQNVSIRTSLPLDMGTGDHRGGITLLSGSDNVVHVL